MKNWIIKLLEWLTKKDAKPDAPVAQDEIKLTDDIDLSTVVWHGPDIRGWKIAADLVTGVSVSGGDVLLKTVLLKGRKTVSGSGVTGNAWAIVLCNDGKYHASTFEWLDYGRQSRTLWKAFDRAHWTSNAVEGAEQKSGTVFYVAVSTIARGTYPTNGNERTPFRRVVHP